jgi:hypothetical protein
LIDDKYDIVDTLPGGRFGGVYVLKEKNENNK